MTTTLRAQITALSVVPAIVIAGLVTAFSIASRFDDLESHLNERGLSLAQRLAQAAEYSVFSGDAESLALLAQAAVREPDVRRVTFVGREGTALAQAQAAMTAAEGEGISSGGLAGGLAGALADKREDHVQFLAPIRPATVPQDALFEQVAPGTTPQVDAAAGEVKIELSRATLQAKKQRLLAVSLGIMLAGLLVTGLIATRLVRRATRPIVDVTNAVASIGRGDLSARVPAGAGVALQGLVSGVNAMAKRLESARDNLESRVREATSEAILRKEEAELANLSKSRFLAMASHDLRQPMHALDMFIAQLEQMPLHTQAHKTVTLAARSSQSLGNLLDALLDISRLDAQVLAPKVAPVPLGPMLLRLEREFGPMAGVKGLQLRVVPTTLCVESDPMLLERMLRNLMANAINYTDRGSVMVVCRLRSDQVRMEIRDSGVGIAHASHEEIFGEFTQLGNSERDRSKGLGLGLAIVGRLSALLGHGVSVRSAPGRGSTFAITAQRAVEVAEPVEPQPAAGPLQGHASVFLIDDDELVLEATSSLLRSWGCEVFTGELARTVLAALPPTASAPNLILCDYRLRQGHDGISEIALLRQHFGFEIPAAIITGDTDPSLLEQLQAAGLPVLSKPARAMKLRALVQNAIKAETTTALS